MLQFDDLGYLTPYETHVLSLEDFERTFVIDTEREKLFRLFTDLVLDLKNLGSGTFYIWADGSFVTKKRIPRDIDLVFFINFEVFEPMLSQLSKLRRDYEPHLDIFMVDNYPENHEEYFSTALEKLKWRETFGTDRQGRRKGIIQIEF